MLCASLSVMLRCGPGSARVSFCQIAYMEGRMKRPRAAVPTRDRILDEVERLIAIKGVYGFKLRDVADRLDLKVPAIYKHYQSRDDVLVEVSRRFVSLVGEQIDSSGPVPR